MHPSHQPGPRNPKLTEGELRAVLHVLDLAAKEPVLSNVRGYFEDPEWRQLQKGTAKLVNALPRRSRS